MDHKVGVVRCQTSESLCEFQLKTIEDILAPFKDVLMSEYGAIELHLIGMGLVNMNRNGTRKHELRRIDDICV